MHLAVSGRPRRLGHLPLAALVLLLAAPALAADVWIVDRAGGPGSDFTGIQSAVSAAADGDTILVRANTLAYDIVVLDGKGLSIVAEGPGVRILGGGPFAFGPAIDVRNVAAGQQVLIRGITTDMGAGVLDCAGSVWFDQLNVTGDVFCSSGGNAGAYVSGSAQVTFTHCQLRGEVAADPFFDHPSADGVRAVSSSVWIFDSEVKGGDGEGPPHGPDEGGNGIRIDASTVTIVGCDVQGGPGGLASGGLGGFQCDGPHATGGDGVAFVNASGTLRRADSTIAGGFADLDRLCPGQTGPAGVAIFGPGTVVDLPGVARHLSANSPVRGGETLTFDVGGGAGEIPALLVALEHRPVPLTAPPGALLLGPPWSDVFVLPALPPSGTASLAFAVPNVGALVGSLTFYAQAVFLAPGPTLWLGSGTSVVLVDASI